MISGIANGSTPKIPRLNCTRIDFAVAVDHLASSLFSVSISVIPEFSFFSLRTQPRKKKPFARWRPRYQDVLAPPPPSPPFYAFFSLPHTSGAMTEVVSLFYAPRLWKKEKKNNSRVKVSSLFVTQVSSTPPACASHRRGGGVVLSRVLLLCGHRG